VTQHLATFNKIISTKGSFSGIKCAKIAFIFGWGFASDPAGVSPQIFWGSYDALQSAGSADTHPHSPSSLMQAASRCLVWFLNMITWQPYCQVILHFVSISIL